jgi:two-component system OmpR family sensor kinase
MISDGSLGPASKEMAKAMLAMASSVEEMAALIDGLAEVARQDDKADSPRRRRCALRRVVASAVDSVELEARSRRVHVECRGPDVLVSVDIDRLRIALVNLLSNAIQHSPPSSTVRATIQLAENAVSIAISDEGHGIPPGDTGRVFDAWHHGSGSSGGLGLGLWIVSRIVDWHGGQVKLDTEPGRGSTFTVILPWNRADSAGSPA